MRFVTAENNLAKALMAYIMAEMEMMDEPGSNRKAAKAGRAKTKFMEALFTWGHMMGDGADGALIERYRRRIGLGPVPPATEDDGGVVGRMAAQAVQDLSDGLKRVRKGELP